MFCFHIVYIIAPYILQPLLWRSNPYPFESPKPDYGFLTSDILIIFSSTFPNCISTTIPFRLRSQ